MMHVDWLIYGVGFLSQIFFSSRMIIQWISSERQGQIINPTIYWQLSLLASILMIIYGLLREDPAIIFGQLITYFIYIRNLQLKEKWYDFVRVVRLLIYFLPLIVIVVVVSRTGLLTGFATADELPRWLLIFGLAAQLIFTARFIYQWAVSEKSRISRLPAGFWYLSVIGSALIFTYGIFRVDPILILGHFGGLLIYLRNLHLLLNKRFSTYETSQPTPTTSS